MISLEDYKKILGPFGETLTEEELKKAYEIQSKMADLIFYSWLEEINKNNV